MADLDDQRAFRVSVEAPIQRVHVSAVEVRVPLVEHSPGTDLENGVKIGPGDGTFRPYQSYEGMGTYWEIALDILYRGTALIAART